MVISSFADPGKDGPQYVWWKDAHSTLKVGFSPAPCWKSGRCLTDSGTGNGAFPPPLWWVTCRPARATRAHHASMRRSIPRVHGRLYCCRCHGLVGTTISSAPQYTEDREQSSNARHISSEGQRSTSRLLFSVKARAGIPREAIHPRPVPLRSDALAEHYQIGWGNLDWRCGLVLVHPHQTARPSLER